MKIKNQENEIFFEKYFAAYEDILLKADVTSEILHFCKLCHEVRERGNKLIFAGNGASASISSQAATDYTQHGGVRAIALNDHNLITAFGNDYGYENWIARGIEAYADSGDIVVLISSSGESPNVVNAAKYCENNDLFCITFTGFSESNTLKSCGKLNFWLNSHTYNIVESTHLIWLLMVVYLLESKDSLGSAIKYFTNQVLENLCDFENYQNLLTFKKICQTIASRSGKLIFAGNGGSSSISSHAAIDFTKQSKVRSIAFNDHNLLTCFANDYGHDMWLAEAIRAYANEEDAVVLISSSGSSPNIIKAAHVATQLDLPLITFSAFKQHNSLSQLGQLNFWAKTNLYGVAQGIHSAWIFSVADFLATNINQ